MNKVEGRDAAAKGRGVPRGYKQTEVGVIPEDWTVSTVRQEFNIRLGKMLDAGKNVGVPKPFLGNGSVQWGHIDVSDLGEIRLSPTDLQRFRLKNEDLLVCEGGDVGRAAIWRDQLDECYYQKALHRLRPKRGYSIELMRNLLERMSSSGFLQNYVTQTSIAHLPKDKFETVPIPVPATKAEQNAIAEALSDADALIESLAQLLAKKRDLKQGAMQELLTGKKRLPGFNEAWTTKPLKKILQIPVTDGPHLTPQFLDDGVPFLSVNNLVDGRIDMTSLRFISKEDHAEFSKKCKPQKGDLLLGKAASVGKVAMVDTDVEFNIWSPIALIRINAENHARFIYFALQGRSMVRQIELLTNSSSQGNIGMGDIEQLMIQLPSLDEQYAIATILAETDTEIAALEARLTKARQLKQGMMQELLTGRIRLI
jgi:type I restriction enzyme S subunit